MRESVHACACMHTRTHASTWLASCCLHLSPSLHTHNTTNTYTTAPLAQARLDFITLPSLASSKFSLRLKLEGGDAAAVDAAALTLQGATPINISRVADGTLALHLVGDPGQEARLQLPVCATYMPLKIHA